MNDQQNDNTRIDPQTENDRLVRLAGETILLIEQTDRLAADLLKGFHNLRVPRDASATFDRMERRALGILEMIADLRAAGSIEAFPYHEDALAELRLKRRNVKAVLAMRNLDQVDRLIGELVEDTLARVVGGGTMNSARSHVSYAVELFKWFLHDLERVKPSKVKQD